MRILGELRYESSPDLVAAMLADHDFVVTKCARMRSTSHTVAVTGTADGPFTVTSTRTMPTEKFPDIARRAVGSTVQIQQVESWGPPESGGGRSGRVSVTVVGKPVRFEAALTLRRSGDGGTVETADGDLSVAIPFFGGQLAKMAEPVISSAMRRENKVGREWLGEPELV